MSIFVFIKYFSGSFSPSFSFTFNINQTTIKKLQKYCFEFLFTVEIYCPLQIYDIGDSEFCFVFLLLLHHKYIKRREFISRLTFPGFFGICYD
jgi:hypothetical protein